MTWADGKELSVTIATTRYDGTRPEGKSTIFPNLFMDRSVSFEMLHNYGTCLFR